ncbi:MAG: RepB family DNA primase [Acidobacteriota bacterium]|nr:RepB family DNA primase [Acidobacteriota bacterium]
MVSPPFLNLEEAERFLRTLGGRDTAFTFQTFDDTPAKRRSLARILHGSFREHRDTLVRLNGQGAGVFVTVQVTNGRGRRTADIVRLRALFIDCDVGELACGPEPAASIVVWSVRGAHCYWLLNDAPPLDAFRAAQQRLALKYGTDPAVCDLARVMRVPGFVHARGEPSRVRLAVAYPECRYDLAEVLRSCPELPRGVDDVDQAALYGSVRAFAAWAACKEVVVGRRNTTAYSIAAEGFRRGLAAADVERVVSTFCWRAGIPAEAAAVARSARRTSNRSRG